jgi:glutamine amidotransferase
MGMRGLVTSNPDKIRSADLVILPGVGAFGDAMSALERLGLADAIREVAHSDRPLIGICLGMQLLMTESYEFGRHAGLGLIEGPVVRFDGADGPDGKLKVPQIGWNRIYRENSVEATRRPDGSTRDGWQDSPLAGLANGEFMYFVHSYYAKPSDMTSVLSVSRYGDVEFCSSVRVRNIFGCQFHPERSGPEGLKIYANLASLAARGSGP